MTGISQQGDRSGHRAGQCLYRHEAEIKGHADGKGAAKIGGIGMAMGMAAMRRGVNMRHGARITQPGRAG